MANKQVTLPWKNNLPEQYIDNGDGTYSQQIVLSVPISLAGAAVDTELPVAIALQDAAGNPTTPLVGACLMVWNGSSFERLRVAKVGIDLPGISMATATPIWSPASNQRFRLMGGSISCSVAGSVIFYDGAVGNVAHRTGKLLADTVSNFDRGQGYLSSTLGNQLLVIGPAASVLTGTLYGTLE